MQLMTVAPYNRSAILTVTDAEYEEFKELVSRAINTWDDAPAWIKQLSMELEECPAAFNARDGGKY
jgi:hypothetical protein